MGTFEERSHTLAPEVSSPSCLKITISSNTASIGNDPNYRARFEFGWPKLVFTIGHSTQLVYSLFGWPN